MLWFILFSGGENRQEAVGLEGFQVYEELSGIRLQSCDQLMRINIMDQIGGYLYAVDPDTSNVTSVINIREDKMVRFRKIGQGPCELVIPWNMCTQYDPTVGGVKLVVKGGLKSG